MTGKHTCNKTEFVPLQRFVTLRFRISDDYTPKDLVRNGIDEDSYATMLCMPLREMLTGTAKELAGELGLYMLGKPNVRRLGAGDMFYMGEDAWLFAEEADQKLFKGAQMEKVDIQDANLIIVRMGVQRAAQD